VRRLLGLALGALVATLLLALTAGQALASHVHCGDVITQDTTLDSDLLGCSGTALTIAGDDVTVNLGGHLIEGDVRAEEQNDSRTRFLITNGRVRGTLDIRSYRTAAFKNVSAETGVLYAVGLAQVTDCNLKGLSVVLADRAEIHDNVVSGDGVSVYRSSAATITGNRVEQSAVGVSVLHSGTATLTHNLLRENRVGLDSSFATIRAIRNRIVANTDSGVAVSDVGIDLIRNVISRNDGDGVRAQFAEGLLKENRADRNGDDGIDLNDFTGNITVANNHTWFNTDLGIEAQPDVLDGGGNWAKHNGNPAQCVPGSLCSTKGKPKR